MFLEGNEIITEAIEKYYSDNKNLDLVLDAIRQRMHEDGELIFPIITKEDDESLIAFRILKASDGKIWHAAFTSQAEYEKGTPSRTMSNFIYSIMKDSLGTEAAGIVINPWGKSFRLTNEMMEKIFKADEGMEYNIPNDPITAELLEDGSFLKKAIEICNRNSTEINIIKLARILRDSWVWVPCNAILSDADNARMEKMVKNALENDDLDSLTDQEFVNEDYIRMVPDILQRDDEFFLPVFTSEDEMGEYGERFSKVARHFLDAANVARNHEKNLTGIVINAFSKPLIVPRELFNVIEKMKSKVEKEEE